MTARIEVIAVKATKNIVSFDTVCRDQQGDVVVDGTALVMVPSAAG